MIALGNRRQAFTRTNTIFLPHIASIYQNELMSLPEYKRFHLFSESVWYL